MFDTMVRWSNMDTTISFPARIFPDSTDNYQNSLSLLIWKCLVPSSNDDHALRCHQSYQLHQRSKYWPSWLSLQRRCQLDIQYQWLDWYPGLWYLQSDGFRRPPCPWLWRLTPVFRSTQTIVSDFLYPARFFWAGLLNIWDIFRLNHWLFFHGLGRDRLILFDYEARADYGRALMKFAFFI